MRRKGLPRRILVAPHKQERQDIPLGFFLQQIDAHSSFESGNLKSTLPNAFPARPRRRHGLHYVLRREESFPCGMRSEPERRGIMAGYSTGGKEASRDHPRGLRICTSDIASRIRHQENASKGSTHLPRLWIAGHVESKDFGPWSHCPTPKLVT